MKTGPERDRRRYARFPQSLKMSIRPLPQLGFEKKLSPDIVPGRIQNISQGGVCILTSSPLEMSSVVRCEILIGDAPVKIATLMQVRWTQKQKLEPESFLSGLAFLL